jgi:hypothetical protein
VKSIVLEELAWVLKDVYHVIIDIANKDWH